MFMYERTKVMVFERGWWVGCFKQTGAAWGCSAFEVLFVSLREKSAL